MRFPVPEGAVSSVCTNQILAASLPALTRGATRIITIMSSRLHPVLFPMLSLVVLCLNGHVRADDLVIFDALLTQRNEEENEVIVTGVYTDDEPAVTFVGGVNDEAEMDYLSSIHYDGRLVSIKNTSLRERLRLMEKWLDRCQIATIDRVDGSRQVVLGIGVYYPWSKRV